MKPFILAAVALAFLAGVPSANALEHFRVSQCTIDLKSLPVVELPVPPPASARLRKAKSRGLAAST